MLPGSGGACEIALNAREVLVIMRQSRRSFVERLDFQTSPGHVRGTGGAATPSWRGSGPTLVVTDLAVFGFADDGEMELRSLHPGVTEAQLAASMAWAPRRVARVGRTEPPSADELRLVRDELDPKGIYTR